MVTIKKEGLQIYLWKRKLINKSIYYISYVLHGDSYKNGSIYLHLLPYFAVHWHYEKFAKISFRKIKLRGKVQINLDFIWESHSSYMTLHSICSNFLFLLINSVLFSVQYTFAQCAAVNTHSSEIRVPENKKGFS